MSGVVLSADELVELTGYKMPAKQLTELRRQGFWRARQSPATGSVVLERAHYEAVCRGADAPLRNGTASAPKVRPPDRGRGRADKQAVA